VSWVRPARGHTPAAGGRRFSLTTARAMRQDVRHRRLPAAPSSRVADTEVAGRAGPCVQPSRPLRPRP
jgi:hypothetical protein